MKIEDFVGKIIEGDCVEVMKQMPENSVDAIVTDPPAGISFMGQKWDSFGGKIAKPKKEKNKHPAFKNHSYDWGENPYSAEVLNSFQNFICQVFTETIRVLKPGGHALVWAIPRTSHHTAMGLERAGFEIRDVISHVFSTGFPKSLNIKLAIARREGAEREGAGTQGNTFFFQKEYKELTETENSKRFEGLGTALKPAVEFWWLCRKPISEPTIAENCLKWGTGGLSIEECRIGVEGGGTHCNNRDEKGNCLGHKNAGRSTNGETIHSPIEIISVHNAPKGTFAGGEQNRGSDTESYRNHQGRFPSNLILDGSDEVVALFPNTNKQAKCKTDNKSGWQTKFVGGIIKSPVERKLYLDDKNGSSASRFFYQAKPSRAERNMGCEGLEDKPAGMAMRDDKFTREHMGNTPAIDREPVKNNHPTVKSIALMEYLVKLISRKGQIVLDPFSGSFSTGVACINTNRQFIGIEKEESYIKIGKARMAQAYKDKEDREKQLILFRR